MRRKMIVANWKMHPPPQGWDQEDSPYRPEAGAEVLVLPSYLHIADCLQQKLMVGAQCGRPETQGAFTGDVSMKMLKDIGCSYVLCGHSERRKYHHETDAMIAEQVIAALDVGLHPILCIGETKAERDAGKAKNILKKQLILPTTHYQLLTIAYEPVWAIGTGLNALPDDAEHMHAFIRSLLPEKIRDSTCLIYGGSANDLNAADFLAHPDIDGLLVGGASLEPERFRGIVQAAIDSPS